MLKEKNGTMVDGKTISQWESELSSYERKTVDPIGFAGYVKAKLLVNSKVSVFYEARIFRKLKLNTFINTRKSEQLMMRRFEAIFGKPEDVVIGISDWEQKKHRKYKEPTKGKGFQKVLWSAGYPVYLVDEL